MKRINWPIVIALAFLIVGSLGYQFYEMVKIQGDTFLQWEAYRAKLHSIGQEGVPWQTRMLWHWGVSGLRALGLDWFLTFFILRLIQNVAVFTLLWFLYRRRFELSRRAALLGLCLTAWAFAHGYNCGLHLLGASYFGVIFATTALLILPLNPYWTIPVIALGVLGREDTVLVALIPLFYGLRHKREDYTLSGILGLIAGLTVYEVLKIAAHSEYYAGNIGLGQIATNLRLGTVNEIWIYFLLIPVLAFSCWKYLKPEHRMALIAGVLACLMAFPFGNAFETHLYWWPMCCVFIPGALCKL
jgi:hypothetical protein